MSSTQTDGKSTTARKCKRVFNSRESSPDSNSDEGAAEVEEKKMRWVETEESVRVLVEALKDSKPFFATQGKKTKKMKEVIYKLSEHRSRQYPDGMSLVPKTIFLFFWYIGRKIFANICGKSTILYASKKDVERSLADIKETFRARKMKGLVKMRSRRKKESMIEWHRSLLLLQLEKVRHAKATASVINRLYIYSYFRLPSALFLSPLLFLPLFTFLSASTRSTLMIYDNS
mmetsp:Transcript_13823/g.18469  ORF Transcript_13823/g.18469 Transcript_13823/m.18469 type:complete len:231 (+) Transcript_13823:35-727(+)